MQLVAFTHNLKSRRLSNVFCDFVIILATIWAALKVDAIWRHRDW